MLFLYFVNIFNLIFVLPEIVIEEREIISETIEYTGCAHKFVEIMSEQQPLFFV